MTTSLAVGSSSSNLSREDWESQLDQLVADWPGRIQRLLLVPPDKTRLKSLAGEFSAYLWKRLSHAMHIDILPALGTHKAMSERECREMFGEEIPAQHFLHHNFQADVVLLGEIPASTLARLSEGRLGQSAKIAINQNLLSHYDMVMSLGQVVPHEVVGMANYTKNIVIGTGGPDLIHKSHFLGALYGIERIMGQIDTPVRWLLDHAFDTYVRPRVQVQFLLTVLQTVGGASILRGIFSGDQQATYRAAAELSQQVNIVQVDKPLRRCVVYLDPKEFSTTWVGNKGIYRTRRAMADGGELLILAPNVNRFGEKGEIDTLIRRFGYRGTPATMEAIARDSGMADNLSAAAHLIHGSTEGRFNVTYAVGAGLKREEIESVGFQYARYEEAANRYLPANLTDGWQVDSKGEEYYFIRDPGQGLWIA
jgi:nickel-dependent lactate racemase